MVTLDELMDAADQRRTQTAEAGRQIAGYLRVGVWSVGWLLAKLVALILAVVAGICYGIGWLAARTVPVLRWLRAAFLLGWEAGRAGTRRPAG